ncbi:WYL domain-containing protein [uncultured Pontibacter sp.]|uniref:helix-turn-helix transcriptional regulator n=1 Tax=uncultured Pontibacter sp. TaxID=453356 RepID=UPI0026248AFB|nr:WYL domain-containing protein [uncultured Pontibacter sp.]
MANKNKLVRLKVLDRCFRNKFRRYTLDDLMEECSEALEEYEGVYKGISKRSVQEDIKDMRSGKFGYEAPIVCEEGYYFYSDRNFSITNTPLTEEDYQTIRNSLSVLEQFSELGQLEALRQVEEKLQNVLSAKKDDERSYIQFEKTEYPAAQKWLSKLLVYTKAQQGLTISYQPFSYEAPADFDTFPLLLKEYNGRWFFIGYNQDYKCLQNFPLDRIIDVKQTNELQAPENATQLLDQLNHLIGVSIPATGIETVIFKIVASHRKYIETKPIHSSQKLLNNANNTFTLEVGINVELKAKLLSFGNKLVVIEPDHLKEKMKNDFSLALHEYGLLESIKSSDCM